MAWCTFCENSHSCEESHGPHWKRLVGGDHQEKCNSRTAMTVGRWWNEAGFGRHFEGRRLSRIELHIKIPSNGPSMPYLSGILTDVWISKASCWASQASFWVKGTQPMGSRRIREGRPCFPFTQQALWRQTAPTAYPTVSPLTPPEQSTEDDLHFVLFFWMNHSKWMGKRESKKPHRLFKNKKHCICLN